jgi:hypothetical protein
MKRITAPGSRVWAAIITLALAGAWLWTAERPAEAQTPYETPPVLSARYLLPPDMLTGPLFQVDDRVPTDGYMGHFTLRSYLGTFQVAGRDLLKIRIAELPAIQQIDQMSKTDVFLGGMANAAARPVEAAVNIVENPVQTVESIPSGIGRFFDRVEMGAQSIIQSASSPTTTSQQKVEQTASRVGDVTITALGFEQVRRQLAKGLGIDPYTTNPVLAEKLTNTAWVAFSGRVGVNLLVSAVVPASMVISATSFTNDLVYDTPKADLLVMNKQKMITMGASEGLADTLLKNRWYSLTVLTSLVTELERLGGVVGRPNVIALATTAENEQEARFLAASVQMLAKLNVTGVPLSEVAARRTVVGITPGGAIVVPAPVDYLSWTEPIARLAGRPDLQAPRRGIWLAGRISAPAQQGFTGLGWTFHEGPSLAGTW